MKDSIDYNDIINGKIRKIQESFRHLSASKEASYYHGKLMQLKELLEITEDDIHEHHNEIANKLLKVRRVVNKM
jgi:hypothetical protein